MKKIICFLIILLLLPSLCFTDADFSPVGRWSISSDYSTMYDNYMFTKTDFFLFDDGSVFRLSITKRKKENDLSLAYDAGVWIGDKSELSIRIGKDMFKAYIDDSGFLYILNDNNDPIKFIRIEDPEGGI